MALPTTLPMELVLVPQPQAPPTAQTRLVLTTRTR